ncbi:uncharacterized protein LOC121728237 [Aricia agestis]|uniref:uncharacterized protein LOC121728237 n=1 Tax=Aricia agestis TaxID=91739 RepID=UPI001C207397|nr:uncharacterized protein LOC121728237 [Aricia agestis]
MQPDLEKGNTSWLHKIDQLGDVYGWDSVQRQFVMQLRLRGSARRWYDELDDYNLDWDAWKRALEIAFPRSVDFVDKLSTMLARNKEESETMTHYYHDKLSLLRKCNISGEDAISCIIRGLPVELRANAKAYKCETPEMLYFGYLSSLENYKRDNISSLTSRKSSWRRGAAEENSTTAHRSGVKRCYICRRIGHEFRDCRAQQRCDICQRNGHTSASCWLAATPGPSRQQVQPTPVSLLMLNLNDKFWSIYKRLAFVTNGGESRGTRLQQDGRMLATTSRPQARQ